MKLTLVNVPSKRIILKPSLPVNVLFAKSYVVVQPGLAVYVHTGVNGLETITGTDRLGLPTLANETIGLVTG